MKTITREINAYTFDELSKDAKDKVRAWFQRDFEDCRQDDLIQDFTEQLIAVGLHNAEICYSGFGSQGDGLSFTGVFRDIKDIEALIDDPENIEIIHPLFYAGAEFCLYRSGIGHYCHERTVSFLPVFSRDISKKEQAAVQAVLEELDDWRLAVCQRMYKDLEKDYEYCGSDEYVRMVSEAQGYMWDSTGTLVPEV